MKVYQPSTWFKNISSILPRNQTGNISMKSEFNQNVGLLMQYRVLGADSYTFQVTREPHWNFENGVV